MQYINPTFTTPTSNGRLSDIEYELAVGLRCPKCAHKVTAGHICRGPLVLKATKDPND